MTSTDKTTNCNDRTRTGLYAKIAATAPDEIDVCDVRQTVVFSWSDDCDIDDLADGIGIEPDLFYRTEGWLHLEAPYSVLDWETNNG